MKAYSEDLRLRIVQAMNDGLSHPEIAHRFRVGLRTVERYLHQWRETGSLTSRTSPGATPAIPPRQYPALVAQLAASPDATLAMHCDDWAATTGVRVSQSTMCRAQQRVGWTRKKSLIASERDEAARGAFRAISALWDVTTIIFLDESGTQTNMTPRYSRSPRGERAYGSAPRNHAKNTTLIACLSLVGLGAGMTLEGALDGDAFVAYLREFLLPTLVPGQMVVMDNLSVHKDKRVRPLIEGADCTLVSLPAYSPGLTPIEQAFSKIKTFLRRVGARSREGLDAAIMAAMATVTAAEANGWFTHCGYRLPSRQSA
ncbi:MAG: IS630 family transposase [Thermomicrobia bacterium]|nr:IS630 family transposase [Thermomicrobia bacterium]